MDVRIRFVLYQSCWNRGSVGRVSVFWLRWCVWGMGRGLGPGSGEVEWCYVWESCESGFCVDGRSRYLYIVLGGYLRILVHPVFNPVAPRGYRVFVYGRYRKSRLVCVCLSDLDLSRHHPLL